MGRVTAFLAALFLVLFTASAMRLAYDDLRSATRATTAPQRPKRPEERMRTQSRALRAATAGGGGITKRRLLPVSWRAPLSRLIRKLVEPKTRPHGSDALGTGSLSKAARHKASGGHGRNGPGAGI